MKEQILQGLLRRHHINGNMSPSADVEVFEGGPPNGAFAHATNVAAINPDGQLGEEQQNREDLIQIGAITPLDDVMKDARAKNSIRERATRMDNKIAERMVGELPHTLRSQRHETELQEKSQGDLESQEFSPKEKCKGDHDSRFSRPNDISIRAPACVPDQPTHEDSMKGSEWRSRHSTHSPVLSDMRGSTRSSTDRTELSVEGRCTQQQESVPPRKVECPICAQLVVVNDSTSPDVALSKHIDRCGRRIIHNKANEQKKEEPRAGCESTYQTEPSMKSMKKGKTSGNVASGSRRQRRCPRGTDLSSTSRSQKKSLDDEVGSSTGDVVYKEHNDGRVIGDDDNKNVRISTGSQPLVDDFDDANFEARMDIINDGSADSGGGEEIGISNGSAAASSDGLEIDPGIAQRLFQFQHTGVRWMWQLHQQGAGGIVGDEMGLGKTVQVASFLGAVHRAGYIRRTLVLCPATVLSHWMAELHTWAPKLRVIVLHRCAQAFNAAFGSSDKLRNLIHRVLTWPEVVIVTSYEGMKSLKSHLLPCNWDYSILDEGQRIRNPDAEVTLLCKQIRTVHRLVLTGTPIQNNLRELWSLFDFVFPGRLGTLPAFETEFANPIRVGGYTNASPMQARIAYRCALVLRDLIHPYLLRRQKKDLEGTIHLPEKTEQVLFCRLTSYQRELYREFLESEEVKLVLSRTKRAFKAIGILRKLCNHPDLVCRFGESIVNRLAHLYESAGNIDSSEEEDTFVGTGLHIEVAPHRSGKLLVLKQILPLWHQQGHRVLLFSQTRQMLTIIESFVKSMNWSYRRLDGNTPVGMRQHIIDRFNADDSIFMMLLTTRTGGVGINLTGANRVILFDPDWNPSTDMQARERSWRVGQLRQVTVYRLITAGTIEEKIYHRQIFKTALTNRVLQNPKQRRMFSADELGDLFTLGDDGSTDGFTDTVDRFQGKGKVEAPKREDVSLSRRQSPGIDEESKTRSEKRSPRIRHQASSCAEGREINSEDSSLLGVATVIHGQGEGCDSACSENDRGGDKSKSDDSAVLQALYDGAPLSSVFHHDIAEDAGVMSGEQRRMEEAAKRAAQQAVNQLRMSRRTLRAGAGQGGFQSSWTGRNGGAEDKPDASGISRGRFGNISLSTAAGDNSRTWASEEYGSISSTQQGAFDAANSDTASGEGYTAGMSSQEILRQIRLRNRGQPTASGALFPEFRDTGGHERKDAYYATLLQRLQDYLAQAQGGVDTAALIHAFGNLPRADVPVFRQMLQAIAVCNNGEWTLRDTPSII